MSDKLQEIKLLAQNAMATGKGHVDLTTYSLTWLIEQLEQAQDMANRWQKAFSNADKQYLKKEKEAAELRRKLEQAQATNQKLKEELAWYATESNYKGDYKYWGTLPVVLDDRGQRAKDLLSELKQ